MYCVNLYFLKNVHLNDVNSYSTSKFTVKIIEICNNM